MWKMTGLIMRTKAILLALLIATVSLSGCFGEDEVIIEPEPVVEEDVRIFVTDKTGASLDVSPWIWSSNSVTLEKLVRSQASVLRRVDAYSSSLWRRSCALVMVAKPGKKRKTLFSVLQRQVIHMDGSIQSLTVFLECK